MAADYPPADATREQVAAWYRERAEEHAEAAKRIRSNHASVAAQQREAKKTRGKVPCVACGRLCISSPLRDPVRIRFSAKFKGRTFNTGETLCYRHTVEPLHEARP